jgi:DNA end-binding protein Ku
MAKQLVESLSGPFEPEKYADSYRQAVLDLIEQKAEGKAIAVQPSEEPQPVPDLMSALEASIAEAKQRAKPKKPAASKKKKPAKTTA